MKDSDRKPSFSFSRFFLTVCLLLAFGPETAMPATAGGKETKVVVEQSPYSDALIYRTTDNGCEIAWTAYTTELNKGMIKHSSRCSRPLREQIPLLIGILGEFLARDVNAASFRMLFWGGLVPERNSAPLEMPFRLALAAYRADGWDRRRGKPAQGDLNRFVKDLANRSRIYPELTEVFQKFHRTIAIVSMEKVRVLEAHRLPFYDELKIQGVQASDKLPFDCMVWFSVSTNVPGRVR